MEIASLRWMYQAIKAGALGIVPPVTLCLLVLAAPLKQRQWQQNESVCKMMMSVELIYFSLFNYCV